MNKINYVRVIVAGMFIGLFLVGVIEALITGYYSAVMHLILGQ